MQENHSFISYTVCNYSHGKSRGVLIKYYSQQRNIGFCSFKIVRKKIMKIFPKIFEILLHQKSEIFFPVSGSGFLIITYLR